MKYGFFLDVLRQNQFIQVDVGGQNDDLVKQVKALLYMPFSTI